MLPIVLMIAPWGPILIKSLSSVSLVTWIARHATGKKLDLALLANQLSTFMKVSASSIVHSLIIRIISRLTDASR